MREPPIRTDGGPRDRLDRIAAIADKLEEVGEVVHREATGPPAEGPSALELDAADAPSPDEFSDRETYFREAQAWITDELQAAAADLEHRTLELQQAVDVYPAVGADQSDAAAHRNVVIEDLDAVSGALERLMLAGTRLAQLEASRTDE
ncbi:MAG: hypothetical protein ABEH59_05400 [Halobacteriales archaeon]